MESINVCVVSSLNEESLRRIAAVSPRIKVLDAAKIWDAPDMVTPEHKGDFSSPEYDALLAQAEVLYGFRPPLNVIARAPKLKWIQSMLAGVDHILYDDIVGSSVILTNMKGLHATPVGEEAVAMMMAFTKRLPFCLYAKLEKRWERFIPGILRYKTVGIVGLGHIGREIARISKTLGMKVIATRRSARRVGRARYVDKLLPRAQLRELFSESDYVVCVLPFTPETDKVIGEKELRAMKPTAYLINVGRGQTIDEEVLIRALKENRIAGAGLDAYAVEPLPADSPLWDLSNVILSPHVSGRMDNYFEVSTALFCENLKRYVDGKKLFNIVNKKLGY